MGIVQCPIHGLQSFYEVCEHIWEDFQNEVVPEMKELPVFGTKVCNDCYKKNKVSELGSKTFEDVLKMKKEEADRFEEKLGSKYDKLTRRIECIECLNKLRLIVARKKGESLPFEAFENTLMHKDRDKIERLRAVLINNFEFQKFKIPHLNFIEAFHLKSGGISYPFSIKFYYVTNKEDQDKLLKLIDDFFEEIPQKERKISFYESENWVVEKNGNKTEEYKCEEKLLFEKIIKG